MKSSNDIHQTTVPRTTVEVLLPDGRILCGPRNRPIADFLKGLPEWNNHDPIMGAVVNGELRELIHLLKFQQVRPAAVVLGRVLAGTIAGLEQKMTVETTSSGTTSNTIMVIPVPLHARKKAQRGFNQAEMIARCALKQLARPNRFDLCTGVLVRRRETGSQIGLTRHQRRENLRGAFAVSDPTRILNRDILLVDDVYTTGTTASECALVLLRAGAAGVWVATVARTLKISGVIAMPEDLSVGSEERVGMAAHG